MWLGVAEWRWACYPQRTVEFSEAFFMTPIRIASIYLVVCSLWILLSDQVLFWLVGDDPTAFLFWQTAKGWLFVIGSCLLVYLLAQRLNGALIRQLDLKRRHLVQVRRKAYTDYLTGLPNRRYGLRLMRRLARQTQRSDYGFCILLLDVDDFKQINDSLGLRHGDRILMDVGQRIEQSLKPGEHLIRQGGDEFLVACTGVTSRHRMAQRTGELLEAIRQPLTVETMELVVTVSVGIACYPDDADQVATLMRSANLALNTSKRDKNCFNFYQPLMARNLQLRFDLQQRLREALDGDQLQVYFQPVYDAKNGNFSGSEALVRWPVEEGFISPAEFIPVAEQSGQIRRLGQRVLDRALLTTQALIESGGRPLSISVNVSPKQFVNGYILADVTQAIEQSGIAPSNVILEITEGVLLNNIEEASVVLHQLIALGVSISLDDFGQGYSSLSYLRQHPFSYLKIDREFIQGMVDSSQDRALVQASVAMARALQLKIVAEGVETAAQQQVLESLAVDYLQGFYLARPMPADNYRALLLKTGETV